MGGRSSKELCNEGTRAVQTLLQTALSVAQGENDTAERFLDLQRRQIDTTLRKVCCNPNYCKTRTARRLIEIALAALETNNVEVLRALQQAVTELPNSEGFLAKSAAPLAQAIEDPPLRISAFTFNTESVPFGRRPADFVASVAQSLESNSPDLIVIATQEDAGNSELLQLFESRLPDYELLQATEAMGVGATTLQKRTTRGLRLMLLGSKAFLSQAPIAKVGETQFCAPTALVKRLGLGDIVRGKGGIVLSVSTPFGKLSIINAHLPFDPSSIKSRERRDAAVQFQFDCLQRIYTAVMEEEQPDYILLLGDLNFRLTPFRCRQPNLEALLNATLANPRAYYQCDELYQLMLDGALPFQEGVAGNGIDFAPTCKLCVSREPGCADHPTDECPEACYRLTRGASWCDRVLFYNAPGAIAQLDTTYYNRVDVGEMAQSDHAGVMAQLTLQTTPIPLSLPPPPPFASRGSM